MLLSSQRLIKKKHATSLDKISQLIDYFLDLAEKNGWENVYPNELNANDDSKKFLRIYKKTCFIDFIAKYDTLMPKMSDIKCTFECVFSRKHKSIVYGFKNNSKPYPIQYLICNDDICIVKENEDDDPLKAWCKGFLKQHENTPQQSEVPQAVPNMLHNLQKKRQKEIEKWANQF